jgi:methylphosphotriester-DNA--protein-cysteine methyltransferase
MRSHPTRAWYVDELCDAIGASRATLERSFNRIYRTSVQRYSLGLRIRTVAERVRRSEECIEAAILEAGFRSLKDAYRPFRFLTGLTFADLRRMGDTEFAAVMDGPLALPIPE